ncbi:corticosteroid-binding globulin isoform X2 [Dasypus novemcinctus]|uniref:corticosteroid-binding globulin isoform X2 n=1 Tax=Dasypus novemcinctus TaxID=9361 RepID=UPI00265F7134|nr:corticosteroid-binding globulin isoform X2 [Dasypus novemcinctus]
MMLQALYICLFWLSTSSLRAIQAEDSNVDVSMSLRPHWDLALANTDFAFTLFKRLVALAPGENTFFSPVSISIALAMLSLGTHSVTQTQVLQGLGFNLTETSEAKIHQAFQNLSHLLGEADTSLEMIMGNALFLDHRLKLLESFLEDIKHYYESEALTIDFQDLAKARREINKYVKNKTQGNTVDIFSKLDDPVLLILVNYIFFKGTWEHPFDPNSTREGDFHLNGTSTVKVPMMSNLGTIKYLNDTVLPCQLVQLDYMGNGTVFFILPEKGKMDMVVNAVDRDTIQRWSQSLIRGQVDLSIPKVSISRAYDLGGVLRDLGIADLFTSQASFSGITQETQLKVSKVLHKAALHLHEKGVMPAATTGGAQRLEVPPLVIKFNRPFLVLIFDHSTWSTFFLGKIVKPTNM